MQQRAKILIVDDHPHNADILEELLEEEYQLAIASSGEEALIIAPILQPDLILLDIMMPGIDGYETCRQLRALPDLSHTKIIMVSAKAMVTERLQGYEAGADDYITKPFEKEELRAKVRVYLRLKSVEELHQLKSDVLSLLQHETRTPLNGIIAPAMLLASEESMEAEERTMLGAMIHESATRLQGFLDKVITLSAMRSGSWHFELTTVDLCDVVRSAVAAVTPQALESHVQIELEVPDAALTMLDLHQMQEALTAILENAIRFSPPEGRVVVRLAPEEHHVGITVTDQGPGVAAEVLPYVFDLFAHTEIGHHTKGQGLSLALARQIVLAHNGTIAVENSPGTGAAFVVRLPLGADRVGTIL